VKPNDLTTLVHLVGFLTGIVLYAMLGVMTLRTRAGRLMRGRQSGVDRIPLATATFGLVWNCGALAIYGFRDFGFAEPRPWLTALAFSALGFLPGVVVHSAVQSLRQFRGTRALVAAAYSLSSVAAILQFVAASMNHPLPDRPALLSLTIGYTVVVAVLALLSRGQPGWRRALSAVALATFAVMAFHLSQHVEGTDSWLTELVGHHASIPLALVILYQDYRFAFADLFLKRAVTLVALVGLAAVLYLGFVAPRIMPLATRDYADPRATSGILALCIATALAYPILWRLVQLFVDRLVLRRVDYGNLKAELSSVIATLETPQSILDTTTRVLAPALSAEYVTWSAWSPADSGSQAPVLQTRDGRQSALVRIATADAPSYELQVGPTTGGRRLLSDDLALLESISLLVARRIDAVRVTQERIDRSLRENEILRLATESELRALRAQLNPHFLFNTLTTIGYLMQEAPSRALDTLYRLTGLLRAVLRRSDGEFTTLGEELEIVESYLAIETARFEERLRVTIDVPEELKGYRIPPLLLQPLVENAIKHGITPRKAGGAVIVMARADVSAADSGGVLHLSVVDTGIGASPAQLRRRRQKGVGLSNVEQRLVRYYSGQATLDVRTAADVGTTVEIRIPLAEKSGIVTGADNLVSSQHR
jgi:two-component system LytT family sensor kinase